MFGSTFLYLPSELMAGQPEGAYRNEVHAISYRKSTFMETDDSWRVILQTVLGKFLGEINLTDDCEISLWLFSNKRRTPLMYLR